MCLYGLFFIHKYNISLVSDTNACLDVLPLVVCLYFYNTIYRLQ